MSDARRHKFSEVVLPHLDSAYRLARGLTGSAADADDVVQEACLRAFKGIDGYGGGSARAWLLTITRNAAFTFMARNRPQALIVNSEADDRDVEAQPDPGANAEAGLIAQADANQIERALASLPAPFREIVILREYNDLSYREIAEMTRTPIGTVMSRLARARAMLLAALAPERMGKSAS